MKTDKDRPVALSLGGMDTRLRPEEGSASLVVNLCRDAGEGTWTTMPGVVPITADMGTSAVSMFWFQPRPNERYLVVERRHSATEAKVSWHQFQNPDTTIATRRRVDNDLGTGETYLEHGRWLYFTSPFNSLLRWDGRRTVPVGFDRPAPSVDVYAGRQRSAAVDSATGANNSFRHGYIDRTEGQYQGFNGTDTNLSDATAPRSFNVAGQRGVGEAVLDPALMSLSTTTPEARKNTKAEWTYAYGMTGFNDLGQMSPMSGLSWVSDQNGFYLGKRMVRCRIPRLPQHWQGCALWRSHNLAGVVSLEAGVRMFLVQQWPATHGFDYLDHAPDSELLIEYNPDEVGVTPVGARAMAYWQGSFWLGGMPDDPSTAIYSTPGFPEQYPEVNRIPIASLRTGQIVAYHAVPRGLVVVKSGGIYLIKGTPLDSYHVETVDETKGTFAPRAIQYIPGKGLFYLHSSGPQLLIGTADLDEPTKVVSVGGVLSDVWRRRVGGRNVSGAIVAHWPEKQELWFHVPTRGDNRPDFGLVYHTESNEWSVRENWHISGFNYYKGALYAVGWDSNFVYQFTSGSRSMSTLGSETTIEGTYLSNPISAPDPFTSSRIEYVGRAFGSTATVAVSTRLDAGEVWTLQTVTERPQFHLNRQAPEWGTATWSTTGYYNDYGVTRVPVSPSIRSTRALELKVSGHRMTLAELLVVAQPDKGPDVLERRS